MKISIITPTWNSIKTIKRNIDSIHGQHDVDLEQIIIDNLSTDGTVEYIQSLDYQIKLISEKDNGISDAFNKGIKTATGDIIGIINSDDCLYSLDTLKRIHAEFILKKCDIVHGDLMFVDNQYGTNIRKPLLCHIKYAFPFNHPTFFVLKSVYERYGLFDLEYQISMDFEFVSRFYRSTADCEINMNYLPSPPISIMHAGGISETQELKCLNECRKILKNKKLWGLSATLNYYLRLFKILLKPGLKKLGLRKIVIIWRKIKWER